MDLSDKLPGLNPGYLQCDCCKPEEPKFFWLDSFSVEVFLEEMEDGKIGYCAWVDVGRADIHTGVQPTYHLAKIAAGKIVNRELALRRIFMLCNKFWAFRT